MGSTILDLKRPLKRVSLDGSRLPAEHVWSDDRPGVPFPHLIAYMTEGGSPVTMWVDDFGTSPSWKYSVVNEDPTYYVAVDTTQDVEYPTISAQCTGAEQIAAMAAAHPQVKIYRLVPWKG